MLHTFKICKMKYVNLIKEYTVHCFCFVLFCFLNWDSLQCKAEQPLQGMKLQVKEAQKD